MPTRAVEEAEDTGSGQIVMISARQAAVLARALEAVLAEARPRMEADPARVEDLRSVEGLRRMLRRAR